MDRNFLYADPDEEEEFTEEERELMERSRAQLQWMDNYLDSLDEMENN